MLSDLTGRYVAQRQINRKRTAFFDEDDLNIPTSFDEAVAFFLNKGIITKKDFWALNAHAKRAAFTLAADEQDYVLAKIKSLLDDALLTGGNIEDFSNEMFGYFNRTGVTAQHPFYYETVFITNIQEALSAGKEKVYAQTDAAEFPYYQFHTVGDDRVRKAHNRLDAFTWDRTDPIWKKLHPPLSFRCRCVRTLVHRDEGRKPSSKARYQLINRLSNQKKGFEFVRRT